MKLEGKSFEEKLNSWLTEVCDQCHEFAKQIDVDFYVFQTPLPANYNPDILIIGINPGGFKSYSQALEEKAKDLQRDYKKRTIDSLYYDVNTLTQTGTGKYALRDRLKLIFNSKKSFSALEKATIMNMVYFNTRQERDLYKFPKEIIEYCQNKTNEFIEILHPQNILFFTSDYRKLSKMNVKGITALGYGVKTGTLNGKKIIAIPHPSSGRTAKYYSDGKDKEITKILEKEFLWG
ncbi:hypothetical protein [Candidatus Symbiothrix dinenymphae]|uniref:hypothetical protein n=1 Tax=Candidatus Symbiothrix dinenymphae TaxID=467085 RepID=UPI0006C144E2|nr:hypothetical protein [Candidatus Symbiothrix dinenymphae]GAP72038.1 hypothetical protein SAMD00024442_22_30 [Candidatus Symbiothrix dinenymphae]